MCTWCLCMCGYVGWDLKRKQENQKRISCNLSSEPWATTTTVWCRRRRCRPMNLSDCPTRGLTHFLSSGKRKIPKQEIFLFIFFFVFIYFLFLLHIFRIVMTWFEYLFIPFCVCIVDLNIFPCCKEKKVWPSGMAHKDPLHSTIYTGREIPLAISSVRLCELGTIDLATINTFGCFSSLIRRRR